MSLFCVGIAVVYFVEFEVSGLEQILLFMIMWCWTMWLQVNSYMLCSWWTTSLGSILRHHTHVSEVNAVTNGGQSYYIDRYLSRNTQGSGLSVHSYCLVLSACKLSLFWLCFERPMSLDLLRATSTALCICILHVAEEGELTHRDSQTL